MFIYAVITAYLFQKGSAESNDPEEAPAKGKVTPRSPAIVRRGGWPSRLYAHSLSLALAGLFLASFVIHAWSSFRLENAERIRDGRALETFGAHFWGATFWFESFQNWQSEFLAILSMVVLTIWLRERGSPQSKPVEAPHDQTGG